MENRIIECTTPFDGVKSMSRSSFLVESEENNIAPFTGAGDMYGIGQGLTAIFDNLPSLGIGSKSRMNETKANADANISIINAQNQSTLSIMEAEKAKSKETEKIVMIGFVAFLVIAVVVGVLFMGK